jgi:hypothetical protein
MDLYGFAPWPSRDSGRLIGTFNEGRISACRQFPLADNRPTSIGETFAIGRAAGSLIFPDVASPRGKPILHMKTTRSGDTVVKVELNAPLNEIPR